MLSAFRYALLPQRPPGLSFHVHVKGVLLAESATFINKLMTSDCSYKEVKHAIQTENLTAVN